jgi:hypothetical protein
VPHLFSNQLSLATLWNHFPSPYLWISLSLQSLLSAHTGGGAAPPVSSAKCLRTGDKGPVAFPTPGANPKATCLRQWYLARRLLGRVSLGSGTVSTQCILVQARRSAIRTAILNSRTCWTLRVSPGWQNRASRREKKSPRKFYEIKKPQDKSITLELMDSQALITDSSTTSIFVVLIHPPLVLPLPSAFLFFSRIDWIFSCSLILFPSFHALHSFLFCYFTSDPIRVFRLPSPFWEIASHYHCALYTV